MPRNEVFISFTHKDNDPLIDETDGWITRFHSKLKTLLGTRLGREPRIWRDPKLAGNDEFDAELEAQIRNSELLISVLSPRYFNSSWCMRELRAFCLEASRTTGLTLGNKSRVFKVLKSPISSDKLLPDALRNTRGYKFYVKEDDAPIELDGAFGRQYEERFNKKVNKLAWEISQLLSEPGTTEDTNSEATTKVISVFLADCGAERIDDREELEADLQMYGFNIVQSIPPPGDANGTHTAVYPDLAIHLLGTSNGTESSISLESVEDQLALTASISRKREMSRVISIGQESGVAEECPLVQRLKEDEALQAGAELVAGDLSEVKNTVFELLQTIQKTRKLQAEDVKQPKLIYVLCDKRDRQATIPLRKFLNEQGYDVEIPVFSGSAKEVRRTNESALARSQGVIIFYGSADEIWRRYTESEAKKVFSRSRDVNPVIYNYLSEPLTEEKEDLVELSGPNIIDGTKGFAPDLFIHCIAAIESAD